MHDDLGRGAGRLSFDALGPADSVLLDTNAILNGMSGRGPPALRLLLDSPGRVILSGPVLAEMSWTQGRLDPAHPRTAQVLASYDAVLSLIPNDRVLTPDASEWHAAGELAGRTARALSGPGVTSTADGRAALLADAVTAVVAIRAGLPVVTADAHFDTIIAFAPGLRVLFYDV